MHIILFILYLLFFSLAITRMHFFSGYIKTKYLLGLFVMHIAVGCLHNWIAFHFYPDQGDIWAFFKAAVNIKQQLIDHPGSFFNTLFSNQGRLYLKDSGLPPVSADYQALLYINVILNFFSFNNIYINTLVASFPVFAGAVALFKVFYHFFKKPLPAFCTLLMPSVLFWTSVVFKDSFFYMAMGFFCYYLLPPGKLTVKKIAALLLCVAVMLISRANAVITVLPAVFFFWLTEKKTMERKLSLSITLGAVILSAIVINAFIPGGILSAISERQKDFHSLTGGSRIFLPVLEPAAGSFLSIFPVALLNGFLQPLPGAGGKLIYTAFSAELLFTWAIVLYSCWLLIRKKTSTPRNFDIACLLFALPGLIMIGYTIPFAGAIIRYRSIYLPFLLAPFLNILCSYPVKITQWVNDWLLQNTMVLQTMQ